MKKLLLGGSLALLVVVLVVTVALAHNNGHKGARAFLQGYSEVPANSTTGHGDFKAKIENGSITYRLRYSDLEGTAQVAHIHFGQRDVNGGVSAFLCGGGGKPACPPSGTVEGTISASDVVGPSAQGIAAGELDELVRAIKHGVTYANVHTDKFPNGEIRGQIGKGRGHLKAGPDNGFRNGNDRDH
jgi:hypothetical protein